MHVAACAKGAPFAGKYYDAHMRIAAGLFQRFRQIASHMSRERIQSLGPVQRDRNDAVVFRDFD